MWEEYLQYLGAVKSWLEALSYIGEKYSTYEEVYAVCDGNDNLTASGKIWLHYTQNWQQEGNRSQITLIKSSGRRQRIANPGADINLKIMLKTI
jgi:hypothetical protein